MKTRIKEFRRLFKRMNKLSNKLERRLAEVNTKPVFNGNLSGCVFAMPGATVNQQPAMPLREEQEERQISPKEMVAAVERVREYFWSDSAMAVVFCVCRDCYGYANNMRRFEREFHCSEGLVSNAFRNNPFMRMPIDRWTQLGAKQRVLKLVEAYKKAIEKP
jgi:hypothetical protein